MYSMKPVYKTDDIEVSDIMYKMKSLHCEETTTGSNETLNPRMKQLEETQLLILKKLANLENEVKQMSSQLGHNYGDASPVPSSTTRSSQSTASTLPSGPVQLPEGTLDFVITVSAQNPSFSPLLIGELLRKRGVNVAFPTHLHSSCKEGSITAQILQPYGGELTGRLRTSTTAKVYLTIMIKDVPFCPSVMYSAMLQTRIIGDTNIARFLTRFLVPDLYDENNMESVSSIDQMMDMAKQLASSSTKVREAAMKSLNAHLGRKQEYLSCDRFTLADIATLSALLSNRSNFNSLPKNVKPWFQRIASNFDLRNFTLPAAWSSA